MDAEQMTREDYLALPDDEKPHLYEDRAPSNATYTGSKKVPGCRCVRCKAAHAAAIKKNRQVIQVEPESVVDQPIPRPAIASYSAADEPERAAAALVEGADPQLSQAVYKEPERALTADDVVERLAKHARRVAGPGGEIPARERWISAQPYVAQEYNVRPEVAQAAIKKLYRDHVEASPITRGLRLRDPRRGEGSSAVPAAGARAVMYRFVRLDDGRVVPA